MGDHVRLVLAGDVMTGRGIDQILAHPGDPTLTERYAKDARDYVALAEHVGGPVPRPVGPEYPWGDVLAVMDETPSAVRLMNLETSVTRCEVRERGKAVLYRMSPANLAVLQVAGVHAWGLANNHVLDHGQRGLLDTLDSLEASGLQAAGAGRDERAAWSPAVIPVDEGRRRIDVLCVAHSSSGVPRHWRAHRTRPGVALVDDLDRVAADRVIEHLLTASGPGDIRVVSIHWGSNWGYEVPRSHRTFARRLIDGGVHVVVGHSSHHVRPVELAGDGLVLHGCGDLVNDYEGIGGYEEYRGDVRVLHLATLDAASGRLEELQLVPFRSRRLRLEHATGEETRWLATVLDRACHSLGTPVQLVDDRLTVPVG
jgi:poly-gamma-glutamate synthesis protein (capsule biosynthesis protein)